MSDADLLAKATARPWRIEGQASVSDPYFFRAADVDLIVAAVNNYERLLEIEAAARGFHGCPQDLGWNAECELCEALSLPPAGEAGG